eukprot:TRINITY_DN53823_c0_g1_i1.p1 TRINITY_DN53823_c0_g1~~TRINITY_DN53823_c0_g1_i1.p1  ORF type:complete len:161 (-),score=23.13 TRINITY_DN53823_c0_g1_i1:41-523(-)
MCIRDSSNPTLTPGTTKQSTRSNGKPASEARDLRSVCPTRVRWVGQPTVTTRNCQWPFGSSWYRREQMVFRDATLMDQVARGIGVFNPTDFPHTVDVWEVSDMKRMRGAVEPCLPANIALVRDLWLCVDAEDAAECLSLIHIGDWRHRGNRKTRTKSVIQ